MKKDIALFTIAHNEYRFLPMWEKYYSQYIPIEDMYVLNNDSTDGSIEQSKCNIIDTPHPDGYILDHCWFNIQINKMQWNLLDKYHLVVYADTDEFIVINEDSNNQLDIFLQAILDKENADFVRVVGYDIAQNENEDAFDFSKTIFSQRRYWYRNIYYDKFIILKKPVNWNVDIMAMPLSIQGAQDNRIVMVHIHKLCKEYIVEKHLKNLPDIYPHDAPAFGYQWKLKTKDEILKGYFYHGAEMNSPLQLEDIPEYLIDKYKGVL